MGAKARAADQAAGVFPEAAPAAGAAGAVVGILLALAVVVDTTSGVFSTSTGLETGFSGSEEMEDWKTVPEENWMPP